MMRLAVFMLVIAHAWCDIYMHSPRGSNNRLAEKSANRNNANRVFDSQVRHFYVRIRNRDFCFKLVLIIFHCFEIKSLKVSETNFCGVFTVI